MQRFKSITNNVKFNAFGQGVSFLINFALIPFIISHTGKEIYGAYILVLTFTGYLGLLDFGVGAATVRYIAEYTGKNDGKKISEIVSASLSFFMIIGLLAAALLFIFSFHFDAIFKVDAYNRIIIKKLFWIAAAGSLFVWPARTFDFALQGLQRYDRFAANNICFTVLTGLSAYFIFTNNLGILWYLSVSSVLAILKYLSAYFLIDKDLLKQHLKFPYFNKEVFRLIFGFSFFLFLNSLSGILVYNLDSIIVGVFVSVSAVAVYSVGYSLQQGFRMLNSLIGGPLFPAYAQMEGQAQYERQKTLLFIGTKFMAIIFVPMVIITIIFSDLFIRGWMGEGFLLSIIPAQILLFFWLFMGLADIGSGMLTVKGKVKEVFKILFLNAIVNLLLSLILVKYFGIAGVALGTTIPMVLINFPLIIVQVCRTFSITLKEYFDNSIKGSFRVLAVAFVLAVIVSRFLPSDRLWIVILEMSAVYAATIFVAYRWFISQEERSKARAIIGLNL